MLPGQQELDTALEQSHFCFPFLQGLERTGSGLDWVAQAGEVGKVGELLWLLYQAASAWESSLELHLALLV